MNRPVMILALTAALSAGEALPAAPEAVRELHGTLGGERFWARLTPPNPAFGNNRVLQLVYTPPPPAALAGAHLPDCPFLLVDASLRLVAWNGRDTQAAVRVDRNGYRVTRDEEIPTQDGADAVPSSRTIAVPGPAGWDERIAPVLIALAWRAGGSAEVPCYDLFAAAPTASAVRWTDTQVVIAGRQHRAVADTAGRLLRLEDASGGPVITVTAWIPTAP